MDKERSVALADKFIAAIPHLEDLTTIHTDPNIASLRANFIRASSNGAASDDKVLGARGPRHRQRDRRPLLQHAAPCTRDDPGLLRRRNVLNRCRQMVGQLPRLRRRRCERTHLGGDPRRVPRRPVQAPGLGP